MYYPDSPQWSYRQQPVSLALFAGVVIRCLSQHDYPQKAHKKTFVSDSVFCSSISTLNILKLHTQEWKIFQLQKLCFLQSYTFSISPLHLYTWFKTKGGGFWYVVNWYRVTFKLEFKSNKAPTSHLIPGHHIVKAGHPVQSLKVWIKLKKWKLLVTQLRTETRSRIVCKQC